jgi:hypothetical protein
VFRSPETARVVRLRLEKARTCRDSPPPEGPFEPPAVRRIRQGLGDLGPRSQKLPGDPTHRHHVVEGGGRPADGGTDHGDLGGTGREKGDGILPSRLPLPEISQHVQGVVHRNQTP